MRVLAAERLRKWSDDGYRRALRGLPRRLWTWFADESGYPYGGGMGVRPNRPTASVQAADIAESIAHGEPPLRLFIARAGGLREVVDRERDAVRRQMDADRKALCR